ncbi:hypothetical protein [Streptomyces chromofuscus]|uniref:Uncharacterized protein n=1 Tax=Streptomyces chromofuscus TaxID=42881 RepID=A0A7M2T800_STRCW|nr:hypothetical protein [Streptomyces chromofuscus]QOV44827.1 hypothetical protein IPT68_02070 [Streptomyces chromofuscus]GGS99905.1 hypothetical protein GCM10010254_19910 [Streptomyces chromofuscus]
MWDISFRSTVRAERLRFTDDPRTAVRFSGTGERESTSRSDRTHLPDRIVPGEEYHDVGVAYRLVTRLTGEPDDDPGGADGTDA